MISAFDKLSPRQARISHPVFLGIGVEQTFLSVVSEEDESAPVGLVV